MTTEFFSGSDWEQSSGPWTNIQVHEADLWPIADNSIAAKDALEDGHHPVVAIGGRTAADGRPFNLTGVVVSFLDGLTTPTGIAVVNIADGMIVRQLVANILAHPATYETAPVVGQPVFVDDSAALGAGVTLSMSELNSAGLHNPLAGYLWYCQDEYADAAAGGPNTAATFDGTLANSLVQQEYCVLLINAGRELA